MRGVRHLHFVGIAGSGMSGIAEVLLSLGYSVSGSDLKPGATGERLRQLGARVHESHSAAQLGEAQVVVVSTAVSADNPELVEARQRGIPVIPRAEMLAELMRLKYGVAIAGSHGKTTTTSMVAFVLDCGGLDPTVIVGGRLQSLGSGARVGRGEYLVAEADESDRSFLKLTPTLAVVTNVDREHLDTYRDLSDVQQAFLAFLDKVPFYGAAIACLDDEPLRELLPRVGRRVLTYGLAPAASVSARSVSLGPGGSTYTATWRGQTLGEVRLAVPGAHNVVNSLAAVAVGLELEISFEQIRQGLESFTGVDRRFQHKGDTAGVSVFDDYGHHPTEIRATLEVLDRAAQGRRKLVVFQPHRYTRTQALWNELCECFGSVDQLFLVDIYPASEAALPGITSEALAQAISSRGQTSVCFVGGVTQAGERLRDEVRSGDVVLTLGAGNVNAAGEALLRSLEERR